MSMKRVMFAVAGISLGLTVLLAAAYAALDGTVLLALTITAGTVCYHFIMRLAVGYALNACLHNRVDYTHRWFAPRAFERRLYHALGVRKWKRFVPTFDPDAFDITRHSVEELVQVTCQSELVHEAIMLLSFLPIAAIIPFGEPAVFVLTSLAAALLDGLFVILQRYNRPRLLRLLARRSR